MFTARTYSYIAGSMMGLVAVNILFLGMLLYRIFSKVSGSRTSGAATIIGDFFSTLMSPIFVVLAVLMFVGIVYFYRPLPHS